MTDNKLQKQFKQEVSSLQLQMEAMANGETIVVGTKEDPIVTNSDLIPI